MNSLVELQVYSDNHGVMPMVGPINFLRHWRNPLLTPNDQTPNDQTPNDQTPNDQTPNERTPLLSAVSGRNRRRYAISDEGHSPQPLTDEELQDYFTPFNSRETLEDNIRDPKKFKNQMVELRRVYYDAIRQLKAGITGQQKLSTQRYFSIRQMRVTIAHVMICLGRLFSVSDLAFLGKFRLMVIVFNLNLCLIDRVYMALSVRDNICYLLNLYKIDTNKSNLDEQKQVSEVRCWITKSLPRDEGSSWIDLYEDLQDDKSYYRKLMRAAEDFLSDPKDLQTQFDRGLFSQNGKKKLVPVWDAKVEKYIGFAENIPQPEPTSHVIKTRERIQKVQDEHMVRVYGHCRVK